MSTNESKCVRHETVKWDSCSRKQAVNRNQLWNDQYNEISKQRSAFRNMFKYLKKNYDHNEYTDGKCQERYRNLLSCLFLKRPNRKYRKEKIISEMKNSVDGLNRTLGKDRKFSVNMNLDQ